MSTTSVGVERRASQRFDFQLPVCIRVSDRDGTGFTQDLSGRGVFFFTDMKVVEGEAMELTLVMPSEITLGESMRVRCRGRIMRVTPLDVAGKCSVAAHFEGYEYLPAKDAAALSVGYTAPASSPADESGASMHTFDWRGITNSAHR